MADKITPTTLTSMSNEAAFIAALNANFTAIANKLDTLVSRDGDTPNQMTADLDMNSKRLINLPAPTSDNEPMRAGDVVEGNVIQFLASAEQAALDAAAAEAGALAAQQATQDIADAIATGGVDALRADYEVGAAITDAAAFRTAIAAVSTTAFAAGTGVTAASWRTALSVPSTTEAVLDTDFTGSNRSFVAAAGYQKLPGGLIMQWGQGEFTGSGSGSETCTLALAFPTAILYAGGADRSISAAQGGITWREDTSTLSQLVFFTENKATVGRFSYFALGY